jgi:hypothetical protein
MFITDCTGCTEDSNLNYSHLTNSGIYMSFVLILKTQRFAQRRNLLVLFSFQNQQWYLS